MLLFLNDSLSRPHGRRSGLKSVNPADQKALNRAGILGTLAASSLLTDCFDWKKSL